MFEGFDAMLRVVFADSPSVMALCKERWDILQVAFRGRLNSQFSFHFFSFLELPV